MNTTDPFTAGIYPNIPATDYHELHYISNSALKEFRQFGPRKWKWHRDNPQPRESTPAQVLGTLFHLAVFEPAKFGDGVSHFVKPQGMKFSTKEGIAWKATHDTLPIITTEENANLLGAAQALHLDAFAGPMLSAEGTPEVTVLATHPTGLPLKMRADWLTTDAAGMPWILDAKSIDKLDALPFSARDYAYDVQCVFYKDVLALAGKPQCGFLFAAVELEPPFDIRLEIISEESQHAARALYEADLDRLAECFASGKWPRKYPDVGSLVVPRRFSGEREEVFA